MERKSGVSAGVPRERLWALTWAFVERVTRIELAFSAWEADVLPLNYTREATETLPKVLVGDGGQARAGGGWLPAPTDGERYGPLAMVNVHVEVYVPAKVDAGIAREKLSVTLADPVPVFAAAL